MSVVKLKLIPAHLTFPPSRPSLHRCFARLVFWRSRRAVFFSAHAAQAGPGTFFDAAVGRYAWFSGAHTNWCPTAIWFTVSTKHLVVIPAQAGIQAGVS